MYELIVVGLHITPYQIKAEQIEILSVHHSSRKWPDEFL